MDTVSGPDLIRAISTGAQVAEHGESISISLTPACGVPPAPVTFSQDDFERLIGVLQGLATLARTQRDAAAPQNAPISRRANLVRQIDMAPDATGRASLWRVTDQTGKILELQLPADLLESLLHLVPAHAAELKSRRTSRKTPN